MIKKKRSTLTFILVLIVVLSVIFYIVVYKDYNKLSLLLSLPIKDRVSRTMETRINIEETSERLRGHVRELTTTIGERSLTRPENLRRAQEYIESCYCGLGLPVITEPYRYQDRTVANVIASIEKDPPLAPFFILGAHYDSVAGTVGADDNASAVAVQLETARVLKDLRTQMGLNRSVRFVSFPLEEPPVFATRAMGSKVHAQRMRQNNEELCGMICLEMVGYTCKEPGCQKYPFPLQHMGYPKEGTFIGIVGNFDSHDLTRSLAQSFGQNPDLPVVTLTVPFNGWLLPAVRLSDHASFWDEDFKAVMITDTAFFRNPHYHRPSDTMDTLDYRFMAELVESLAIFFTSSNNGLLGFRGAQF